MAEEERKTHVERIYGKDESEDGGPDNSDMWVDLEVVDRFVLDTYHPGIVGKFPSMLGQTSKWELAEDRGDLEKLREFKEKKVKNPDDEEQYVIVKVWDQTHADEGLLLPGSVKRNYENADDGDGNKKKQRGEDDRVVEVRKCVHRDIDDEWLTKGTDAEGEKIEEGEEQPPRDPKEYLDAIKKTDSTDKDQYVKVEYIKSWKSERFGPQATWIDVELDNSILIPPADEAGDESKEDKPVRLDPLQWIVNVGFGGIAAEFGDKDEDAPGMNGDGDGDGDGRSGSGSGGGT